MVAAPVPNGKQYFPDINGAPLVGGKVYFYEPLTLVPKNTWQEAEQTSLNTNPIILDSRGQATIYGIGSYRQILTDANNNLIWDKEINGFQASVFGPLTTIASATTTDLGTAGSNNVLIQGTTTINSFGSSAQLDNPVFLIQFNGILTITYNPVSMILPGAANITTAAGDAALVQFENVAGYWKMIAYFASASAGVLGTAAFQNIGTTGATVPLLNGVNEWGGSQNFARQTYSTENTFVILAGATTPDFSTANNFNCSITANLTINNPLNVQQGQSGVFVILNSAAGLSVTWGGAYKAQGGIGSVNLSGVNGATDYFAYYAHNSTFIVVTPILNPT